MRITLVSPYDPHPGTAGDAKGLVGGVERALGELAQAFARRGHDVELVCSTAGEAGRSSVAGDGGGVLEVVREQRRLAVLRAPVCRLARHLAEDADVVQVPATYPFTTAPVLRRARDLAVPSVLDFHFEPVPQGRLGQAAAAAYRQVGPRSYRWARAVLVRSLAYAQAAPSLAAVEPARLRVVPNGIDPQRFRPDGKALPGDYLLFVGRLVPYKGVEVLLHALARARPGLPLVVAGDGPLRDGLQTLAGRLGVEVRFLGRVPEEELPRLYRGARLTVLPSVNRQEAFGIALLESMACGTPVVASDLPGVAEVARLGGRTCPPGDADALAATLRQALAEPTPGGAALAGRIHAGYSWDAVADRVLEVYREALEPKPVEVAACASSP